MKSTRIPIIIGTLISGIFIAIGAFFLQSGMDLNENGIHTTGTVVQINTKTDSDGDRSYYPVVEFQLGNGELFTQEMPYGSSPAGYDVGDPIEIAYYAGDPSSASVMTTFWIYVFPGIFIGVGIFIQLIFIIIFVAISRSNKKAQFGHSVSYSSSSKEESDKLYERSSDKNKDRDNPFLMD